MRPNLWTTFFAETSKSEVLAFFSNQRGPLELAWGRRGSVVFVSASVGRRSALMTLPVRTRPVCHGRRFRNLFGPSDSCWVRRFSFVLEFPCSFIQLSGAFVVKRKRNTIFYREIQYLPRYRSICIKLGEAFLDVKEFRVLKTFWISGYCPPTLWIFGLCDCK